MLRSGKPPPFGPLGTGERRGVFVGETCGELDGASPETSGVLGKPAGDGDVEFVGIPRAYPAEPVGVVVAVSPIGGVDAAVIELCNPYLSRMSSTKR